MSYEDLKTAADELLPSWSSSKVVPVSAFGSGLSKGNLH